MTKALSIETLDLLKEQIAAAPRTVLQKPGVVYADVRVEVGGGTGAEAEDGEPRGLTQDYGLSIGVRVIAGNSILAAGYDGRDLGPADVARFDRVLKEVFDQAVAHARANARHKALIKKEGGILAASLRSTELAPVPVIQDVVPATFKIDPRGQNPQEFMTQIQAISKEAKAYHPSLFRVWVGASTQMTRQIFASSEGSVIDQSFVFSGGTVFLFARSGANPLVDLYHHCGNQCGPEALFGTANSYQKTFREFVLDIAQDVVDLTQAKPCPTTDEPVTVVIDPDLAALFAHEVIGHPSERDRQFKMETGYAGRSWFFKNQNNHQFGKQVASPLVTAFSDPTLEGPSYGHYKYDDEGTPAKRVYHIRDGIYEAAMNSRETASIDGAEPNGHFKANDAAVVPLIRMSVSAIAPGDRDPKDIIKEVDRGYYACGHRIPSIAESRENLQISARKLYEIRNGEIGELLRDGRHQAVLHECGCRGQ